MVLKRVYFCFSTTYFKGIYSRLTELHTTTPQRSGSDATHQLAAPEQALPGEARDSTLQLPLGFKNRPMLQLPLGPRNLPVKQRPPRHARAPPACPGPGSMLSFTIFFCIFCSGET